MRRYDDRGTSLVLALIFISVGSLILMAVLAIVDTSMRSTMQLASQDNTTAAAEGAANIAINALRNKSFGGTDMCFDKTVTLSLLNFYTRPDNSKDSARVDCDLDTAGTIAATPPRGLLTLDPTLTNALGGPVGIAVTNPLASLVTGSLQVKGDVQSNSNIVIQPKVGLLPGSNLTSSGAIRAIRACSSGTGLFSSPLTCNTGTSVPDPMYPHPTPADVNVLATQPVPACDQSKQVYTFSPGRYTDFANLTILTSPACFGGKAVLQFLPGLYYFRFAPPDVNVIVPWTLTAGTVIGGALQKDKTLGNGMPLSGNCVSPLATVPPAPPVAHSKDDGVTFVFSGGSSMVMSNTAKVELCGRYAGIHPPIAVYAEPTEGFLATTCAGSLFPCAAIVTPNSVLTPPPTSFVVQGTVYLPTRELVLGLNNTTTQSIRGGAVVHRTWAVSSRGANSGAVIETPSASPRTVVSLNVYVCVNSSSCDAPGGVQMLRARVSIVDGPTGARQVTVLSWSVV
jgi:hypothetical protein